MSCCPFCNRYENGLTHNKQSLSRHLENEHVSDSCFRGSEKAHPWRCSLCPGGKRTYKRSEGLADHLLKMHMPSEPAGQAAAAAPVHTTRPAHRDPMTPNPNHYQLDMAIHGDGDLPLKVPCLPWLPRPRCCFQPPRATLLLATWNLEQFSVNNPDKVNNICKTLMEMCGREGTQASVVVALQEVFSEDGAAFLTRCLNDMEKQNGGSGRVWYGMTSDPLGNNEERAAFLWSGPPASPVPSSSQQQGQPRSGTGTSNLAAAAAAVPASGRSSAASRLSQAPLHVKITSNFQLFSGEVFKAVIRSQQQELQPGRYLRSPYFGLFRVGYANVVVVNVHLAAKAKDARSELSDLHSLAEAIQRPNARLLRRYSCWGYLMGRKPRGLVAVVGDFNCPLHETPAPAAPAPATTTTTTTTVVAATPSTSTATTTTTTTTTTTATATATATPGPSAPAATVAGEAGGNVDAHRSGRSPGKSLAGRGPGSGAQGSSGFETSWQAFLAKGWRNALPPNTPTNWRANNLKDYDAICLQTGHEDLVTRRGVCQPPADVDPSQRKDYPNHLLCWVLLDLGPLQEAPGKVRTLLAPEKPAVTRTPVLASTTASGA